MSCADDVTATVEVEDNGVAGAGALRDRVVVVARSAVPEARNARRPDCRPQISFWPVHRVTRTHRC
jgi:hypothetical protein